MSDLSRLSPSTAQATTNAAMDRASHSSIVLDDTAAAVEQISVQTSPKAVLVLALDSKFIPAFEDLLSRVIVSAAMLTLSRHRNTLSANEFVEEDPGW
eukprot:CAMPEP_0171488294 /NCGR_PEP_ID=MMETSP0958-20121227/2127_1 /TAXON_ID=87120 /ORGANISM="Aurantiochytrium limacinum, Strain ATCCMYA-1381" /LENGTH=97 /DNA_ID=CAMNT_0012021391 /DNA_START=911 /DNA_END=1201 /DNA_ORIENTATION=-